MSDDVDTMRQMSRVKVFDYSSAGKEIEDDEALKLASAAFRMGWEARKTGASLHRRPQFADESLVTDWITGWERCDQMVRR